MMNSVIQWWDQLRIQHKVWAVLLLLCLPLVGGLATHLYTVQRLLSLQQQRQELVIAHEDVHVLRRLTVDIEDGFRGFVLTQRPVFLDPLTEAEAKMDHAFARAATALEKLSHHPATLEPIERELKDFLKSKHELITAIQKGDASKALAYVQSGEGLRLSDRLKEKLRVIEDHLEHQQSLIHDQAVILSERTFVGLWIALAGVVILGLISSRVLARSLTVPITKLQSATARLGEGACVQEITALLTPAQGRSQDELGQLAVAYLEMARRIETHIGELEVLSTIGHEINTIGPDGLDGVLHRILDRAGELVQADVCLILLRNERMGCWIVEAASGIWDDRLKTSIMLWEELPVCVQAYATRDVAIGERLRSDGRPQVVRRNLIGESMFAIPLLAQGLPFGVLAFLSEERRSAASWNQRLAKGLAQEAALAISNARLYEAAQEKQRGLTARLRHLEHLAETLAHDLKGPGSRMEELATILSQKFSGQLDERTARLLALIQENGREIVERVEAIIEVARVGTGLGAVTAVDPRLVIDEVLKGRSGNIEQLRATIHVDSEFPLVACHAAYLRQVFDNLISNALKYQKPNTPPIVTVSSRIEGNLAAFSVQDQGIGIPPIQRTRVFQPFVRLMASDAKGSGIGLTIVQRIVELYGGAVTIDGAQQGGCTVTFTLPRLREDGIVAASTASPTRPLDVEAVPSNLL
ncbi:putative Histidine kinase [Nitrospira japonica]|uniref:histidine kinase n=1 Tax=Nitrospira japonica TaxID=1325564 RepID=A0A1W1I5T7_9BACT|nr:ATP-binding protein [Nitrospira japonica]SLM48388.1 putative Histidine kinase [Nitrospira japonica]